MWQEVECGSGSHNLTIECERKHDHPGPHVNWNVHDNAVIVWPFDEDMLDAMDEVRP